MVGSAYLYSKDFSAIQTALQTLMAPVHPEKVVPAMLHSGHRREIYS